MKFKPKGEDLIIVDLKKVEDLYNIKLPLSYNEFMLKYNGMNPSKEYFFKPDIWEEKFYFEYLLSIKYGRYNLERANIRGIKSFPENHLTIGHVEGGTISLSLKKQDYGSIHVFYSDGEMYKLADSFTEFLDGLEELEY
ncbi:SMI1 / KNR4 family (SUKH-1) [Tenacibaculum sp. 190524A05c]|uniref:SMI1/KNR4 family protein n=1 Tax=Tenacibaculum platacis TaxID=3137852 RepID=UPI0031FB66EA